MLFLISCSDFRVGGSWRERKKNPVAAFCGFFHSPNENIKVMSGMAVLLSENIACHCRIVDLEQFFSA